MMFSVLMLDYDMQFCYVSKKLHKKQTVQRKEKDLRREYRHQSRFMY